MYTILVVDDDDAVREATIDLISTDQRFRCVPARDCAEALTMLKPDHGFDLVLTDLHLGSLSGLVLIATLRQNGDRVPVILMSGHPRAKAPDGIRFLAKPYVYDTLIVSVTASLGIAP